MDRESLIEICNVLNVNIEEVESRPATLYDEHTNLIGLDLSNFGIRDLGKVKFSSFIHLEGLNLSRNQIFSLPSNLFDNLRNLEGLYIWGNYILELPNDIFSDLTSLKGLWLNNNQIKKLPVSLFSNLSSLEQLHLERNSLHQLPPGCIQQLNNLHTLNLSANKLETLPKNDFQSLEKLTRLDLSKNQITELDREIFLKLSNLQNLDLSSNQISELPTWLFKFHDIKVINFDDCYLSTEDEQLLQNTHSIIASNLKRRQAINVFISHAVLDFETHSIKQLADFLEAQEEVFQAYYCERDLQGDIDSFMNEYLPQSQLVLFVGTRKSIFDSVDCLHELSLAKKHHIPIIPIKGTDIDWNDFASINLDRELGQEYLADEFESFLQKLYNYITQYKRSVDLFDTTAGRIERVKLRLESVLDRYIRGSQIDNDLIDNLDRMEILLDKVEQEQLTIPLFLDKWKDLL